MRSYQDFLLGLALLLFAFALTRRHWTPRLIAYLMALSGLAYLVQGWVVGSEDFSNRMSTAIVVGWAISVVWMIWLTIVA